ncbi:MAG: hypothetical protein EOO60_12305 [Hymenobacter sp.]|nr:MAG: hypothetical protein EOO60_12305 [Hymenobacter sp.]
MRQSSFFLPRRALFSCEGPLVQQGNARWPRSFVSNKRESIASGFYGPVLVGKERRGQQLPYQRPPIGAPRTPGSGYPLARAAKRTSPRGGEGLT